MKYLFDVFFRSSDQVVSVFNNYFLIRFPLVNFLWEGFSVFYVYGRYLNILQVTCVF